MPESRPHSTLDGFWFEARRAADQVIAVQSLVRRGGEDMAGPLKPHAQLQVGSLNHGSEVRATPSDWCFREAPNRAHKQLEGPKRPKTPIQTIGLAETLLNRG